MSLLRNAILVAGLAAFSLNALAGGKAAKEDKPKYPVIEMTGVSQFDPSFAKGKEMHNTLQSAEDKLAGANKDLAKALKVAEGTSIDEMLGELKKRAGNKLEVGLEKGRVPKIKATDAIPSDVQAAVDALNASLADVGSALEAVELLPAQAAALMTEVKDFPSQISPDLLKQNNLAATDLPKVTKKTGSNLKAIEATPERIKGVTDETLSLFTKVQSTLKP